MDIQANRLCGSESSLTPSVGKGQLGGVNTFTGSRWPEKTAYIVWAGLVCAFQIIFHCCTVLSVLPKGGQMLVLRTLSEADRQRWAGAHTATASKPVPASPEGLPRTGPSGVAKAASLFSRHLTSPDWVLCTQTEIPVPAGRQAPAQLPLQAETKNADLKMPAVPLFSKPTYFRKENTWRQLDWGNLLNY